MKPALTVRRPFDDEPGGTLRLGERMEAVFGRSREAYEREVAQEALPRVFIERAHHLVTASGASEMLHQWKQEARASNAGAKPIVSMTAVLTLFVAHALAGKPITYKELATTLELRLRHDQRVLLGIRQKRGTHAQWYDRMWAAVDRLVELIDPYPGPRNRVLRGDEWRQFLASTQERDYINHSARMNDRFDELVNAIVRASVDLLPSDLRNAYKGNIAIDATRVRIAGRPNAASEGGDRSNPDPFSGRYRREGDHDGKGAGTDEAAYELETAVMVWNQPKETGLFPSLVTAVSMHQPGQLSGHGARLIALHKRRGYEKFLVCVDRAYNGGKVETFHIPARLAGAELVMDYKRTELGLQGWFEDLILVDGNWYVNWMPESLITASRDLRELEDRVSAARGALTVASRRKKSTAEQLDQDDAHRRTLSEARGERERLHSRLANRELYRMKEHGGIDADGAQRFRYPDPSRSITTPTPRAQRKSLTIPMYIPETEQPTTLPRPASGSARKLQPIKHVQKFRHSSREWRDYYGMRNLVEASNRLLKKGTKFNIADPDSRSGRGYAFTYLATAMAVVADNVLRIKAFFDTNDTRHHAPQQRARRRKDAVGNPLPRRLPASTAPPR